MISDFAWVIPFLPAAGAILIAMGGKRAARGGAEVGIAAVGLAFLIAVAIAIEVFGANVDAVAAAEHETPAAGAQAEGEHSASLDLEGGARVLPAAFTAAEEPEAAAEQGAVGGEGEPQAFLNERSVQLTPIGGEFGFEAGSRVDGLVAMMFLLVTFVSLMVHIYSTGYMHGDPRFTYFFVLLGLFTSAMLLLVIANNLMLLLVGWELVGICSFLLIGFWWEEKENSNAAIKAFLTTKLGDVGLMVGVITLWSMFRTFNIGEIIAMTNRGVQAGDIALETGLLTFGLLALFVGAIGKSAQFPLHTWLPDAMAGPTPVSALIHAATMVTAGIFLIARLYPVYLAAPIALDAIAVIGAITLFAAGLLALVQDDVKRVLAYSTISQLGYMVAALAFSYTAGIFHLFTHGFFKALLFLGAGSLIHSVHSNNMSDMGGLRKFMPVTFATFIIGSAALAALPPLAGFWSKDEVLAGAFSGGGYTGLLVGLLGGLGGLITAFYMTRVCFLVFGGQYRGAGHPHESPGSMKWPLVILAVPATLIGLINLPFPAFHPKGFAAWTMFDLGYFEGHPAEFVPLLAFLATAAALTGIFFGWRLYAQYPEREPMLGMGLFTDVLVNKYYLDNLYTDLITRTVIRDRIAPAAYWFNDKVIDRIVYLAGAAAVRLGKSVYEVGDQKGIDGAVNGIGQAARWTGARVRTAQSGNVQLYAGGMFLGVIVLGILFAVAA